MAFMHQTEVEELNSVRKWENFEQYDSKLEEGQMGKWKC